MDFPGGSEVKNLTAIVGYVGLIPGLGRSPLQYSCLGNPRDKGAWWHSPWGRQRVRHDLATKQQIKLKKKKERKNKHLENSVKDRPRARH